MVLKLVLLSVNLLFVDVRCANILGIFPAPGYSQYILGEALMAELANRGHQITVISPYSPKTTINNFKTIKTAEILDCCEGDDMFALERLNLFSSITSTYKFGYLITETTLKNGEVQELLKSKGNFDLVIVEEFFCDALKGFATHFNAPMVLFSSMGTVEWNKHSMGIPALPSVNALSYLSYTNQMTFIQRVKNLIATIFAHFYKHLVAFPQHREYITKYFPTSMEFDEVIFNASLMLLNSHVTTSENVLLPYNMIEIGGFHIHQNPLSQDIQDYLDAADNGAILFSLGSNLRSADLSSETLEAIFSVFGKLKQKVLWKFEKDFPNKPPNVLVSKWLKQQDILAHPNVQLFITHGGLLSTTEAIHFGVPMVGIPIFGDQKMNMARATANGIAKVISFQELSEETLSSTIKEVLSDPKYRENVKRLSSLLKDRVVKPLDLATYWIEYVIRHRGFHFKTAALRLHWFQFYMVDMVALVLFVFLSVTVLFKFLFSLLRNGTNYKKNSKNKKKLQ